MEFEYVQLIEHVYFIPLSSEYVNVVLRNPKLERHLCDICSCETHAQMIPVKFRHM